MKYKVINVVVGTALALSTCSAFAGDKIDVPKVITKSDAEKILGVPGKDAKGHNQSGKGGYYDSEWSYHAVKGDKWLYFDVLYAGQEAPPHLTQTMFSVLPADNSKSTRIDGLGDKAIFCPNETGMAMLHVLKGDILITIGIHGLPANAVLDSEKSMATKILANLQSSWLAGEEVGRLFESGSEGKLLSIPYFGPVAENVPLTPALLRLDPMFDPLRKDSRFEKLAHSDGK